MREQFIKPNSNRIEQKNIESSVRGKKQNFFARASEKFSELKERAEENREKRFRNETIRLDRKTQIEERRVKLETQRAKIRKLRDQTRGSSGFGKAVKGISGFIGDIGSNASRNISSFGETKRITHGGSKKRKLKRKVKKLRKEDSFGLNNIRFGEF